MPVSTPIFNPISCLKEEEKENFSGKIKLFTLSALNYASSKTNILELTTNPPKSIGQSICIFEKEKKNQLTTNANFTKRKNLGIQINHLLQNFQQKQ